MTRTGDSSTNYNPNKPQTQKEFNEAMHTPNSSVSTDPTLPEDVQVLIKAAFHLCKKATPIHSEYPIPPTVIGYKVPRRELDRVRSKVKHLTEWGLSND